MPDAAGNFKGIAVPASAWDRVFGPTPPERPATKEELDAFWAEGRKRMTDGTQEQPRP